MVNGRALFAGVSEKDQAKKIFEIMGVPQEVDYPELRTYAEWDVFFI